jgi:death-on-curing protein
MTVEPSRKTWRYVALADYLLIAEAVLKAPAEELARLDRISLAESALNAPAASFGGEEAYPAFATKAAVLAVHLCKNHPLPDGNKRCAYLAMLEFVQANGFEWAPSPDDPDETDGVFRSIADGTIDVEGAAAWVEGRLRDQR